MIQHTAVLKGAFTLAGISSGGGDFVVEYFQEDSAWVGGLCPELDRSRDADLEPVDGAAVDQGRKHAKSVAKRVSDGTHRQHNVQILLHAFHEVVVHRQRRHLKLTSLQQQTTALSSSTVLRQVSK